MAVPTSYLINTRGAISQIINMDGKKAIAFLFMLLFALSSLSSTIAIPSSRSFRFIPDENISTQRLYDKFQKEGRMDMEVADYTGTGANNHHDPKSPPETP